MNKTTKPIKTFLTIIAVVICSIILSPVAGTILRQKAEHLAEKNGCIVLDDLDFKGLSSQQYKCDGKDRIEQKINSYIKQSVNLSFFGFLFFLVSLLIVVPFIQILLIYFGYQFGKWMHKQSSK